jgi:hypothetical protein
MDFNSRMTHLTALKYEQVGEQQRLDDLATTEKALKEALFSISSDDAVEEWARTYERMARDGDFPIVIVPNGEVVIDENIETVAGAESFTNFENWMRWLFGSETQNISP